MQLNSVSECNYRSRSDHALFDSFKKACAWSWRIRERADQLEMERRLRLAAVVAMALCCCCLIHVPTSANATADAPFPPGLELVQQDARVAPPSSSSCATAADDQDQAVVIVAGDAEAAGEMERMDLELEDYPGSGANDRHSPWAQQRRN